MKKTKIYPFCAILVFCLLVTYKSEPDSYSQSIQVKAFNKKGNTESIDVKVTNLVIVLHLVRFILRFCHDA